MVAGVRMQPSTTPASSADAIVAHVGEPVTYPAVVSDGVRRVAERVLERLDLSANAA